VGFSDQQGYYGFEDSIELRKMEIVRIEMKSQFFLH
jgi:hypothetical protein